MAGQSEPVRQSASDPSCGRAVSAEVHPPDRRAGRSGGGAGVPLRLVRSAAPSGVPQVSCENVPPVLSPLLLFINFVRMFAWADSRD